MAEPKVVLGTVPGSFPLLPTRVVLRKRFLASHWHLMGKAGMGKSKMLESYCLQAMRQGIAYSFIDPHGDSVEAILRFLIAKGFFKQPDAFDKLKYIEFKDEGPYVAFNVLKQPHNPSHTIASDLLDSMHRAWPALAGGSAPQFDVIVLSLGKVLIDNGLPLPAFERALTDKQYRDSLLANVTDGAVLSYWRNHFDRLSARDQADQVQSTIRRIFRLSFVPVLRYSLGQLENSLDFRHFMDTSQVVLYNLGKLHDEDAKVLLGCLITKGYERAALSRGDSSHRPMHVLLIDEFATFSAKSEEALGTMLSQTRKFGLFSVLAHQSWGQLGSKLQGALQNCQVDISFQIGPEDADVMAKWFATIDPSAVKSSEGEKPLSSFVGPSEQRELLKGRLMQLPPRHALVKVAGRKAVEIVTPTVPDTEVDPSEVDEVKKEYQRRLTKRADEIQLPHEQDLGGTPTHR